MAFKCASCGKPLYNRRRKTCEFCDVAIPEAQRLSQKQQAFLEHLKADEAREHRDFMNRQMNQPEGGSFGDLLP